MISEDLSSLKINFEKCEMILLNIFPIEGEDLATILDCKLSQLPITYLDVSLLRNLHQIIQTF
jgi:hypothetical protein